MLHNLKTCGCHPHPPLSAEMLARNRAYLEEYGAMWESRQLSREMFEYGRKQAELRDNRAGGTKWCIIVLSISTRLLEPMISW